MTLFTGLISFFVLPPVYQANTLLMVSQATDKLVAQQKMDTSLEEVVTTRLPIMTMNTYVGQLKSEALMRRVIKALNLETVYTASDLVSLVEVTAIKILT